MFEKATPLDRSKHKELTYSPLAGFEFARKLSTSILDHSELLPASKHFPIVFSNAGDSQHPSLPQALLSLVKEKNAFVAEDGGWNAGYVPKHIRRYPFILGRLEKEKKFAVMIDETAPQFAGEKGTAMFNESGEPSKVVETATKFLEDYQKEINRTVLIVREIEKHELLKPMAFNITQGNQDGIRIKGFRVVDFDKLLKLDDQILAQWVRTGIMRLIYAHLFSLQNLTNLAKLQRVELPAANTDPI